MNTASTQRESLGTKIAELDSKLQTLRPRLETLRAEVGVLIERENRQVRLFAEADRREKKQIDEALTEIVDKRGSLERECKAVSIFIAELEETRNQIMPEYERLVEAQRRAERRTKIEELRLAHQRDQQAEQRADRALVEARERSNRSFFLWRAALDQEAVDEMNASVQKQKEEWAKHSGPKAPNNRRELTSSGKGL